MEFPLLPMDFKASSDVESSMRPSFLRFIVDPATMADGPDSNLALADFIDYPVIPDPQLPQTRKRPSKALAIPGRLDHEPVFYGP